MSKIVERFSAAVQALVGDGPIKGRLTAAYCEYLEDLQQVEMPIKGKGEFGKLHLALHSVAPVGELDSVRASVKKMSADEAWRHARTIVRLYAELLALEQGAKMQTELALKPAAEAPPRFLVGGS